MFVLLAVLALVIGVFIGTVGIGGILLIPALSVFLGLSTHVSMATALFSFLFTGIAGTCLYQRHGSIDWHITVPVCVGAVLFAYLGALVNSRADVLFLRNLLSLVIIFAGVYTLRPWRQTRKLQYDPKSRSQRNLLLGIGASVGFASGLTGTGGPVLSVPIMMIFGFAPLTTIATSQVLQIAIGLSGSVGNMVHGQIDFYSGFWVTVLELAGVMIGVRLAHRANAQQLRRCVAILCIIVGVFILCSPLLRLGVR